MTPAQLKLKQEQLRKAAQAINKVFGKAPQANKPQQTKGLWGLPSTVTVH